MYSWHDLLLIVYITIIFEILQIHASGYKLQRPTRFSISPQLSPTLYIQTITPEDIRFAKRRCTKLPNEHLNILGNLINCKELDLNDKQEHCYIKCVLQKLGLINLKTRGLEKYKVIRQLREWEPDLPEAVYKTLSTPLDDTCLSYFNVWMQIRNVTGHLYQIAFFEDNGESAHIYNDKHKNIAKDYGVRATKYCEEKPIDQSEASYLSVSFGYREFKDNIEKYYKKCIFEHFHYIDAYGRVDEQEIILSLREANVYNETNHKIVKKCAHNTNQIYAFGLCEMAYKLEKCLAKNLKDYQKVFDTRDQTTSKY